MKDIFILGIETSCDDASLAILHQGNLKAHRSLSSIKSTKKWGGIVPEVVARDHVLHLPMLLEQVLEDSHLTLKQINLISVTTGPGLVGPLLMGLNFAKTLALFLKCPIYSANHLFAHLEAIHLDQKVTYPYLGLLISGGHTIFFLCKSSNDFEVIGGTLDDAIGEAFDKAGRMLGLGYPAGPIIDKLAKEGDEKKFVFPLSLRQDPRPLLSFSGLKNSFRLLLEKEDFTQEQNQKDLCASFQKSLIENLLLKTHCAYTTLENQYNLRNLPLVIGGGVACNSYLKQSFKDNLKNVFFVTPSFCTDNGAMIANLAHLNKEKEIPYPNCLSLDVFGRFKQNIKYNKNLK